MVTIILQNLKKYVKVLVDDPFNKRDIIFKLTKKQKGIYVWESFNSKDIYKYRRLY